MSRYVNPAPTRSERWYRTIVNTVGVFLSAWWAMILLGITHGFDDRIPAFGFWTVFFGGWALKVMLVDHFTEADIRTLASRSKKK